jgi:precorrin-6y C5,15-methyltransferase (decarboxylating) CbiE subunit
MIRCVGVGPGDLGYLTQRGADLIRSADVVAGFDAVVDLVRPLFRDNTTVCTMGYRDQTEKLKTVANAHHSGADCVIVFMGDIHFSGFQLLERVELACGHAVDTFPGISSAQVLASRAKVCFDETTFITFHRRGDIKPFQNHLLSVLKDNRNAIVIPRPWDFMPKDVAQFLLEQEVSGSHLTEVWENLTQKEVEWSGTLKQLPQADKNFSDMCIMLIRCLTPFPSQLGAS